MDAKTVQHEPASSKENPKRIVVVSYEGRTLRMVKDGTDGRIVDVPVDIAYASPALYEACKNIEDHFNRSRRVPAHADECVMIPGSLIRAVREVVGALVTPEGSDQ